MTLLAPAWLALALAAGVIIWLHTLRPRNQEVVVPSTLLWERVQRQLASDARWRRLLTNVLLVVQVLAITCLALALARPAARVAGAGQESALYVLDASASMGATDAAPHRFAQAAAALLAEAQKSAGAQFSLVIAGPRPEIALARGAYARLSAAVEAATLADAGVDWPKTAQLVASLLERGGGRPGPARVIVFTDGAFDPAALASLTSLPDATLDFVRVGVGAANVGITAFEARQSGDALGDYQILITLQNAGDQPVSVPLTVRSEEAVMRQETVTIAPRGSHNFLFPYRFHGADVLSADIGAPPGDLLAADDRAHLVFRPPAITRVLVVGPGNYFLERGLSVFPGVVVTRVPQGGGYDLKSYQLIIFDRVAPLNPSSLPPGAYVFLDPGSNSRPPAAAMAPAPRITWWDRGHPLLRFVDWDEIQLSVQDPLPTLPGAATLVETEAGPLVTALDQGEQRILALGFDLFQSDFPTRVAFPIFLSNVLAWANPRGWQIAQRPLVAAEPYSVSLGAVSLPASVTVWGPDGSRSEARAGNDPFLFRQTTRAGLYRVRVGDREESFAVNVSTAGETDIRPRTAARAPAPEGATPDTAGKVADTAEERRSVHRPLWPYAATAVFLLLILEAWLFANRQQRSSPVVRAPAGGDAPPRLERAAAFLGLRSQRPPSSPFWGSGRPPGDRKEGTPG